VTNSAWTGRLHPSIAKLLSFNFPTQRKTMLNNSRSRANDRQGTMMVSWENRRAGGHNTKLYLPEAEDRRCEVLNRQQLSLRIESVAAMDSVHWRRCHNMGLWTRLKIRQSTVNLWLCIAATLWYQNVVHQRQSRSTS
jgi:hypothetical protein